MISAVSGTNKRDKPAKSRDKRKKKDYRKRKPGEKSGRKLSARSQGQIERIQALWNLSPEQTLVRMAYLTETSYELLKKWVQRGFLTQPTVAMPTVEAAIAQAKQTVPVHVPLREDTPPDNSWDVGPVPTIESIRRQIKRNIAALILDPASVQKYSAALAQLHTVNEKESESAESEAERMLVMIPAESHEPDAE